MKALAVIVFIFTAWVCSDPGLVPCDVKAQTESGEVCGRTRYATNGDSYASFRGIPYAKPPLGALRFAAPQKANAFLGTFDASETGPICPQTDVFYAPLMAPRAVGEDCLRVNVHVPTDSLPDFGIRNQKPLLPVLAWIHGGGFCYGSGDDDVYGPEYLMAGKGIVLVTFNYRLNVFGFLSLASKEIPGNAGLRDIIFVLNWIQNNIEYFGGNPEEVTLGGQSAGGILGHLISISPAIRGKNLFKNSLVISGTALNNLFTCSPNYAKQQSKSLIEQLKINYSQTSEAIHKELIQVPLEEIVKANKFLIDQAGFVSFSPVTESHQSNVVAVIPKDPDYLLDEGYGKEFPMLLSFTDAECQTFRKRIIEVSLVPKWKRDPKLILPFNLMATSRPQTIPLLSKKMLQEYYNGSASLITLDKFMAACADSLFKYPAMRTTLKRLKTRSAPTYIYQFDYTGIRSVFKQIRSRTWAGAAHVEDMTYFFRANHFLGPSVVDELGQDNDDSRMKNWLTDIISHFVKNGFPARKDYWPPTDKRLQFLNIDSPLKYNFTSPTPYMLANMKFYDDMYRIGRGTAVLRRWNTYAPVVIRLPEYMHNLASTPFLPGFT